MSESVDPAHVIARDHPAAIRAGRPYPGDLPDELAPWHCYLPDGGHSIVVVLDPESTDTVPAPVRAVLRAGWSLTQHGYVQSSLPYDPVLGLVTDPTDDEHDPDTPPAAPAGWYAIVVGQPYHPTRREWPEQAHWRLSDVGVELVIFYRDPQPAEVAAIGSGPARFALLAGEHALILAHRFGDRPWGDTPWQACRQTDLPVGLAVTGPGSGLAVIVTLVDASTGLVRANRVLSWTPGFVAAVRSAIRTQVLNRSTDAQGTAEIDRWFERYPTTPDLVRVADITTRA